MIVSALPHTKQEIRSGGFDLTKSPFRAVGMRSMVALRLPSALPQIAALLELRRPPRPASLEGAAHAFISDRIFDTLQLLRSADLIEFSDDRESVRVSTSANV
jgi:hypothetical protein